MYDMKFSAEEQAKNRQTFIEALRSGEDRQVMFQSEFFDVENDEMCYCATGLAMHLMRLAGMRYRATSNDYYGMTFTQWGEIIRMNDRGKTFAEIADFYVASI